MSLPSGYFSNLGCSFRHLSVAFQQRGLKAQPFGGLIGLGNSPVNLIRWRRYSGDNLGVAESKACV